MGVKWLRVKGLEFHRGGRREDAESAEGEKESSTYSA